MSRSVSGVGRGWSRSHYQTSKRGSLLLVMGFAAYLQFGYAGSKVNLVEAAEKMPADAYDFRPSEMGANLTERCGRRYLARRIPRRVGIVVDLRQAETRLARFALATVVVCASLETWISSFGAGRIPRPS
jgi:hypothetical protein